MVGVHGLAADRGQKQTASSGSRRFSAFAAIRCDNPPTTRLPVVPATIHLAPRLGIIAILCSSSPLARCFATRCRSSRTRGFKHQPRPYQP